MATTISDAPRISSTSTIDNNVEIPAVKDGVDKGKITLGEICDYTVTGTRNKRAVHGIRFLNSDSENIDVSSLRLAYEQEPSSSTKLVYNIYINGLLVHAKDEMTASGAGSTILIAPTNSNDITVVLEDNPSTTIGCISINRGYNDVTVKGKIEGPVNLYVDTTKVTVQQVKLSSLHIGSNMYSSISVLDIYLG